MFKISNHICSELENSSVILKKLELTERGKILDLVLKKYIDSSKTGGVAMGKVYSVWST